jgi:hypothetical protein
MKDRGHGPSFTGWMRLLLLALAALLAAIADSKHDDTVSPLLPAWADPAEDAATEWLTAGVLKERIARASMDGAAQNRPRAPVPSSIAKVAAAGYAGVQRPGGNRVTRALGAAGGTRRLQTVATGPLYPVFADDLPPNITATFEKPMLLIRPTTLVPVPISVPASCDVRGITWCAKNLSDCLGRNVENRLSACGCFLIHGMCFKAPGCIELLPRVDVLFCFDRLFCDRDTCVGNGAGGAGVAAAAALAVVAAAVTLAWEGWG